VDDTVDYNIKNIIGKKNTSDKCSNIDSHSEISKIEREINSHLNPKKDDTFTNYIDANKNIKKETYIEEEVEDKVDLILNGEKTISKEDSDIEIDTTEDEETEEEIEYIDLDEEQQEITQGGAKDFEDLSADEISEEIFEERKNSESKKDLMQKKKSLKKVCKKGKQIVSNLVGSGDIANRVGHKVYSQDTGEILGIVSEMILDKSNKTIGLKIKNNLSNAVIRIPIEQFRYDKRGLIFIPRWFTKASNIIEKLEFVDRMYPELKSYLSVDEYNEKTYEFISQNYPDLLDYFEDGKDLKQILDGQIEKLNNKRQALSDKTIDLTKMRLMKDIDRKEFSEDIQELQRKSNIFDLNIGKYKELLEKLNSTSIGIMCNNSSHRNLGERETRLQDNLRRTHKEDSYYQEIKKYKDMTLNELLVELIEDRLVDDIKKELIKNKFSKNKKYYEK